MPEIIPNWHPMLVHYSIALLSISTLLFLVGTFTKARWKETVLKTAHINLWLGALISVGTVAAGLYASNTVAHDSASHAQMMNHRNWAIPTAISFIILALWSAWNYQKNRQVPIAFVGLMLIATGALSATGFKGAELVYRHGTGVMSLPQSSGEGHSGHAHEGTGHGGEAEAEEMSHDNDTQMVPPSEDSGDNHTGHAHDGAGHDESPMQAEPKRKSEDGHEGHNHAH